MALDRDGISLREDTPLSDPRFALILYTVVNDGMSLPEDIPLSRPRSAVPYRVVGKSIGFPVDTPENR